MWESENLKRVDQITLRQLRALKVVVREGSILAAGDVLGLTGPAVHNQLKTLEDIVGSPVLLRRGRERNTPTPQGEVLIAAYDEAHAALERAIHGIVALDRGEIGSVVLGVVSTAKYFAPQIVAMLMAEWPGVEVVLQVGNRDSTIAALARGKLDLCIMGRPPREPLCDAIPFADHPHVIIAPQGHPLAHGASTAELLEQRFIMREPGSGTRSLATRFLDEIGGGQDVRMIEMDSNETIKQAVLSGLGIAIISAHTVAEELRSGRLITLPVAGMPILRTWYLLTRSERELGPAASHVRDWIVGHAAEFLPDVSLP